MSDELTHPVEREYAVRLGLFGWICLLARAIGITFSLLFKAAKAALGGSKHGHTFYRYIVGEGMRDYQYGLSAVGIQNLLPSTSWTCRRFARKNGLPHATIHLRDGTTAVRIGESQPSKAVVFFHGGGYMAPALSDHAHFACGFAKTLPAGVAVYVLQYALASETANHYPRQLQQAVSLLEYVLNSEKLPPSAVTLVGDSAGGHLAISLLLHLAHPKPQVPPLPMAGRLAGAALISPWVINADPSKGYTDANKNKDILYADALDYWARNFLGAAAPDSWTCPLITPGDWWADIPVDDILVTYGEDELLRENATEFVRVLQAGHARTTAVGYAGEFHVHMVMNRFLRINGECKSEEQFRAWLRARIDTEAAGTEKQ
ncbi:Alpha/beta hydrolase fold-3 [Niveomyces insectorum RCEF 264]|uniref:Alpha/beta hydrolase fold-3 n=1 Tax=Niveomyces insectorum RCEF 264 TaxID=1081102 RepID=A0A167QGU5_9HYPO|nr:Alpha/beta hydrolase fold-3 [Niveomyces insectorum RCEF 264]